jgi:hypothetical protein
MRLKNDMRAVHGVTLPEKYYYLHGDRSEGGYRMTDKPEKEE